MQKEVWENEYRKPRLVTGSDEPQTSVKDFLRWLRRERDFHLENSNVLDLGCGNGKNSIYIAGLDQSIHVTGIDISETALTRAKNKAEIEEASKKNQKSIFGTADFKHHSIGEVLPFTDIYFDLILDVTSSNSLSEKERAIYLSETYRTLKLGGYFFVRALCKDGDKNAQTLLKQNPGAEKDTYIMPEMGLTERVFSKQDFIDTYSPNFTIHHLEKETHYSKFSGKVYKRNFWVAYLQKEQKTSEI